MKRECGPASGAFSVLRSFATHWFLHLGQRSKKQSRRSRRECPKIKGWDTGLLREGQQSPNYAPSGKEGEVTWPESCSQSSRRQWPPGASHRLKAKVPPLSVRNNFSAPLNGCCCFLLNKPLRGKVFGPFKDADCPWWTLACKLLGIGCGYGFVFNRKHTAGWKAHKTVWKLHSEELFLFGK